MNHHDERWFRLLNWLTATHGMEKQIHVVRKEHPGRLVWSLDDGAHRGLVAGFGLFNTGSTLKPCTPLFTIPASALVNARTLRSHYVQSEAVSAIQLISLHLYLHRPNNGQPSSDPLFGPYISILPEDFAHHPLSLTILAPLAERDAVLSVIPPSVLISLDDLERRFKRDLDAVATYLER